MRPRLENADIDTAVEDPPLLPLAGAVVGLLITIGTILAVLFGPLVGVPFPFRTPYPFVAIGIALFVGSMFTWDPDV